MRFRQRTIPIVCVLAFSVVNNGCNGLPLLLFMFVTHDFHPVTWKSLWCPCITIRAQKCTKYDRSVNCIQRSKIKLIALSSDNNEEAINDLSRVREKFINSHIEEETEGLVKFDLEDKITERSRKMDIFRKALYNLASLSLIDYNWRSAVFKKAQADRLEKEWVSRMMGEDHASYVRPMDADISRRGPLGNAEKSAVEVLFSVIEEEGKRARYILDTEGELIRPIDLLPGDEAGPLSELERRAIHIRNEISDEVERVWSRKSRPKDMKHRGPLGEAEARTVLALDKISDSEKLRMEQIMRRGGDIVRPIDIPGPLGEVERYVGDIVIAERHRVKYSKKNGWKIMRPKDVPVSSGLGEIERKVEEDWELLRKEENERFLSFKRFLRERRPMEVDGKSPLGLIEAFTVRLLNGPKLLAKVINRVKELLSSEELDSQDRDVFLKSFPASEISEKTRVEGDVIEENGFD